MLVPPSIIGVLGDEMVDKLVGRYQFVIGGVLGDKRDRMDHPFHPKKVLTTMLSIIAWVNWEQVLEPKSVGGCGVGSIRDTNIALLTKWKWRYKREQNANWYKVIKAIHFQPRRYVDIPVNKNVCGAWKDMISVDKELLKENICMNNFLTASVGSGETISFWLDSWIGGGEPLKIKFPDLFLNEKHKRCTVADRLSSQQNSGQRKWEWKRRPVTGVLDAQFQQLLTLISDCHPGAGTDLWRWEESGGEQSGGRDQVIYVCVDEE
ncbi:hypothetical protein QVD17_36470 [Tagetes erecta]|uniref:RNA-directed DNA polymerase, eukaryota, Reverse transcriptase zinc-binding domain protein n=1 Tax=Tagetes erecta TaxID=13708 RepID=A0AAD8NHE6_TARER|nr:hypothetical protein QVD17_36470 [Tagetes erecta]